MQNMLGKTEYFSVFIKLCRTNPMRLYGIKQRQHTQKIKAPDNSTSNIHRFFWGSATYTELIATINNENGSSLIIMTAATVNINPHHTTKISTAQNSILDEKHRIWTIFIKHKQYSTNAISIIRRGFCTSECNINTLISNNVF